MTVLLTHDSMLPPWCYEPGTLLWQNSLQAGYHSCHPNNTIKTLNDEHLLMIYNSYQYLLLEHLTWI